MMKQMFLGCALMGCLSAGAQLSHLDPAFGTGGMVIKNLESEDKPGQMHVSVQSDGKIVAVGQYALDGLITRFLPNGQPDLAFGNGGSTRVPYTAAAGSYSNGLAFRSVVVFNDRIIAGGISSLFAMDTTLLVAFKPDGKIDSAFGTNGIRQFNFSGLFSYESIMSMQKVNDSQFIAVGYAVNPAATSIRNMEILVAKFDKNGNLVQSFGENGGFTYIDYDNGNADYGYAFTLDNNGNIYVAGSTYFRYNNRSHANALVAKLKPSGIIDSTFGTGGRLMQIFHPLQTSMRRPTDEWFAIALQDNKLLLGGSTGEGNRGNYGTGGTGELLMERLTLNGKVDSSFAANGLLRTSVTNFYPGSRDQGSIDHIVVLAGNKIAFAGAAGCWNADSSNIHFWLFLSGLNANGSKDNTFGTNGYILLPELPNHPAYSLECAGLTLHTDGSLYQAGVISEMSGPSYKLLIAKFKGNGVSNIPGLPGTLSGLKVYPTLQQAGGTVTLAFGEKLEDVAQVYLADISGKLLETYRIPKGNRAAQLQLPGNMAAGMYLLRVATGPFAVTQKIVIR